MFRLEAGEVCVGGGAPSRFFFEAEIMLLT